MELGDVAAALLYVVPGFIASEVYRARYPAKKDSDFGRITWSMLYSMVLIGIARWLDGICGLKLFDPATTFPELRTVGLLLALAGLLGGVMIGVHAVRRSLAHHFDRLAFLHPDPISIWALVHGEGPSEWVRAVVSDGAMYVGWVERWSFDPDADDHDLLLKDARRVNEQLETLYEIRGKGLYLKRSDIVRMEFLGDVSSASPSA